MDIMQEGNDTDNETAKKMCLWLDTALRAERQSFALALEKRHCMLVTECMKQHGTMFMQVAGVPKKAAVDIQSKQQNIAEEGEQQNAEQQGVNGAQRDSKSASSVQAASTNSLESASPTPCSSLRRQGSKLDEIRQPSLIPQGAPHELDKANFGSSTGSGTMSSFYAGLFGNREKRASAKRGTVFAEHGHKEVHKDFLHDLVKDHRFELFFVFLIVLNTVVMALESQYDGFGIGLDMNYPDYHRPADEVWPGMKSGFRTLDLVFGIAFSIELFVKLCGLRLEFFCDGWNLFDAVIVFGWCVDAGARGVLPIDLMMLRLARLARLMRLLKVLKTLKGIDPLFLMVTTLRGSTSILFWVFIFMLVVQTMSALLMNQILVSFYLENDNNAETKKQVFKYFGSFSRSMLSMFELTMGNWVPIARLLLEDVSEWFLVLTIIHKLSMGFAVLGVINGIFIQETFKVASCDDTLMMMQKARAVKVHTKRMKAFFEAADESGDGVLDQDEFRAILQKDTIRAWLSAQELDASDADNLYVLLDQGAHGLSAEDLVNGVTRLKGASRSIDLTMLMYNHKQLKEQVETMHRTMPTVGQGGPGLTLDDQPVADFLQASELQRPIVASNLVSDLDHTDASFRCTKVLI